MTEQETKKRGASPQPADSSDQQPSKQHKPAVDDSWACAGGAAGGAAAAAAASGGDGQPPPSLLQLPVVSLAHAVSSDRGTRPTLEDVHVCCAADAHSTDNAQRVWHFGLFDGHGGVQCATFAAGRLHAAVLEAGLLTRKAGTTTSASSGTSSTWQLDVKAAKQAIAKGFADTDAAVLAQAAAGRWSDGATAAAVWLVGHTALVANVGDTKAVLARAPPPPAAAAAAAAGSAAAANGQPSSQAAQQQPQPAGNQQKQQQQQQQQQGGGSSGLRAVVLTREHLAVVPAERARIERAGGHVSSDGRLNGRIQVSRSFGDGQFKQHGSSAEPHVMAFSLGPSERFLLLACDGLWSVMAPQDAVDLVAQQLAAGCTPKQAANRLLNEAVQERRCKDNVSVVLVVFRWD